MRPKPIAVEDARQTLFVYRTTIPTEYEDSNGHMNVRYYMAIFDEAGYPMIEEFGLTPEYLESRGEGGFDLEHHLNYLNEVRVGDDVSVYVRIVGFTPKRTHYLMLMVNETRGNVASTFECINSYADLKIRKTAPYPLEVAERIQAFLAQHQALAWDAPVCGVMSA
jgi:acyl-CoA thioester hydrolase